MVKEYGYEYHATIHEELIAQTGWLPAEKKLWGAYCLRSGRDALKVIAREHPNATVLLPSLCCDSMVTPFELHGCKICFYPLTERFSVDDHVLHQKLCRINGEKVLLFYNYFGIEMFQPEQLRKIKGTYSDMYFAKDITHDLLHVNEIDPDVDYTVASIRKWVGIPDGGLLWTKHRLANDSFADDARFAERRLHAQCLRTQYFSSGDENVKSKYRKIFSEISALLDEDKTPVKMSEYSYELTLRTDWTQIRDTRRENADVLTKIFCEKNMNILNTGIKTSDLYVPISVNNRDEIQRRLSAKGIFNTIIWPLRESQTQACPVAKWTEEHMLAVPCDQRYTKEDMAYIGAEIARIVNE